MAYIPDSASWLAHSNAREAWLAARRSGIGASEIAGVLGAGRWCSALSVYADKVDSGPPVDQTDPERLLLGRLIEPVILGRYADVTGRKTEAYGHLLRSKRWPWMLATMDGLSYDDAGQIIPVEAKNTQDRSGWSDGLPADVWVQVQQQLAVADMPRGAVAVLICGCEFKTIDVEYDHEFVHDVLVPAGEAFWNRVKRGGPPPDADGSEASRAALSKLFPECDETSIVLPYDFVDLTIELAGIKERQGVDAERRSQIENRVRQEIGSATIGVVPDDGGEFTWKANKNGVRTLRYRAPLEET